MIKNFYITDSCGNLVYQDDYVFVVLDVSTVLFRQIVGVEEDNNFIFKELDFNTHTVLNINQIKALIKINEYVVKAKILDCKDPVNQILYQLTTLLSGKG